MKNSGYFRKIRYIVIVLAALMCIMQLSACGERSTPPDTTPATDTGIAEDTKPPESPEPDVGGDIEIPQEQAEEVKKPEIINNGGHYVKIGEYIYYRQANTGTYEEIGLFGEFEPGESGVTTLCRIGSDGMVEQLGDFPATEGIYYMDGKLYSQYTYPAGAGVFAANLDGLDSEDIEGEYTSIHGSDEARGLLFFSRGNELIVYNTKSNTREYVSEAGFLFYDEAEGVIYFEKFSSYDPDEQELKQRGQVTLCSVNADGTDRRELAVTAPDLYEQGMIDTESSIITAQKHGDYIYFSYGGYAGTGHFFQEGNISRVKPGGSDYEVLAKVGGNGEFCVYDEASGVKLIYTGSFHDEPTGPVSMDIVTGEVTAVISGTADGIMEYSARVSGKPFIDLQGNIAVFLSPQAPVTVLVSSDELAVLGYPGDADKQLYEIEYVDGNVFFRLEEIEETPEFSIGWRTAYRRCFSSVYCKDMKTQDIKLLYSF